MDSDLVRAVKAKDSEEAARLVAGGCDLEWADSEGMTALCHACQIQSVEIVKLLVDAGANASHKDQKGFDPEGIACWYGEVSMNAYSREAKRIIEYIRKNGSRETSNK